MLKTSGFTIIELLATMAILAIVFTFTVPSYRNLSATNNFRSQNQALWGNISTARNSALTNKRCPNQNIATAWQVVISGVNNVGAVTHTLNCIDGDNFATDTDTVVPALTLEFTEIEELEIDDSVIDLLTTDIATIRINFLSGSAQTRIEQIETDTTLTRINEFRIVMGHTFESSEIVQTICLERVSGFPSLNKYSNTCEADA